MQITGAESKIMEALWRLGPLTADGIVAEVAGAEQWGEATVKTLINRLLKKKAIQSARIDGRHHYRPLLQRADYVQAESQGLLDRLFGGQLAPLVTHFAEHRELSPEDVARLKRLIEELGDGD
jgi:BlaI family transcriptional regulator, penicillinase repressor